ncbi:MULTISPECIES: 1,4-dihydroxy-2-naphthoate polyprenyltransferase [unclassified Jeotgalibaca]|uniref:1,4-dihydroxy-2-naphthoate polyprenyltransferase n=1 Tax=unclassified Jeotgalibaca TaxID=2621505 RepID=UPI003FD45A8F
MSLSIFLELVEIRTKLASIFPFSLGILYALYYFDSFDGINTLLFFVAMIVFDMATTAINNTMDYVKAKNLVYRDEENVLGREGLSVRKVTLMIVGMIAFATMIGLIITYRTSLLLLVIGAICFAVGILYTFGPFPISRMPLGEVLSGLTMGFGIFFIAVLINVPNNALASVSIAWPRFAIEGDLVGVLAVFLSSLPLVFTIANIMLANNICDFETDVSNHRYTLTYYIGKPTAVKLYGILYYGVFVSIGLAVILRVMTPWMLGVFLVFPLVQKNIRLFKAKQMKSETFALALVNLVAIHITQIILLTLGIIF